MKIDLRYMKHKIGYAARLQMHMDIDRYYEFAKSEKILINQLYPCEAIVQYRFLLN